MAGKSLQINKKPIARSTVLLLMIGCTLVVFGMSSRNEIVIAQTLGRDILAGVVAEDESGTPMVFVPQGNFTMGIDATEAVEGCHRRLHRDNSARGCDPVLFQTETPPQEREVDAFWIDQFEVTFEQYRACIRDGVCESDVLDFLESHGIAVNNDLPYVSVSAAEANALCVWRDARLPTEAEWEYAAKGPDNFLYPWGSEFDGKHTNICDVGCDLNYDVFEPDWDDGYDKSASVGSFEWDKSWVDAYDLLGNVSEWTSTRFEPYEGYDYDLEYVQSILGNPTIRGANYQTTYNLVSSNHRWGAPEDDYAQLWIGFRCARTPDKNMPVPEAPS